MPPVENPIFQIKGRIVLWVDADTPEVHFLPEMAGHNRRIRLKDEYAVEKNEQGHDAALALAKQQIGDAGEYVWATNGRHHTDRDRLEARLDKTWRGSVSPYERGSE